jgi:hypothetical protein
MSNSGTCWIPKFKVTEMAAIVANPLRRLVELVGIEPTTSSLRTMRSPS